MFSAKNQRLHACHKLITECCWMGYRQAEVALVGWVKKGEMENRPRMELVLARTPETRGAALVRY